jgi:hypothetical protein
MGDSLVPNGLSMVCKVLCSKSEIIVHETDEPNALVNFLDSEPLTGEDGRDVDLLSVHADAAASGDQDIAVVHRVAQLGQALIAA